MAPVPRSQQASPSDGIHGNPVTRIAGIIVAILLCGLIPLCVYLFVSLHGPRRIEELGEVDDDVSKGEHLDDAASAKTVVDHDAPPKYFTEEFYDIVHQQPSFQSMYELSEYLPVPLTSHSEVPRSQSLPDLSFDKSRPFSLSGSFQMELIGSMTNATSIRGLYMAFR